MENSPKLITLFNERQIEARIAEMGADITAFYSGKPLTVIVLANGALCFAADLIRKIRLPLFLDVLGVSSYHDDRRSELLDFRCRLKLPVEGRHILLADEVLDSGVTLLKTIERLKQQGALSVRTAVMVQKDIPGRPGLKSADWVGFNAPDSYLVGYGLDSNELYRNLPDICVLQN